MVAEKVPCALPPLPAPIALGGVPTADGTAVVVTKDGLVELGRYLAGVRAWITVASECIGAGK